MSKTLILLIHTGGQISHGEEGLIYEGPPPRMMRIKKDVTLAGLKKRIHAKLNLQPNQHVTTVVYRCPQWSNIMRWIALPLTDDEDVECMIATFESHASLVSMELYVDVESGENEQNAGVSCDTGVEAAPSENICSFPLNTQLSMAENYEHGFESNIPSITRDERTSLQLEVEDDHQLARDDMNDPSDGEDENEEEEALFDEDVEATSTDDEEENEDSPAIPTTASCPPVAIPPEAVYMPPCPQFSQINWGALDNPDDFRDLPHTWMAENELYAGLQFPSKNALILAIKHYCLKRHHTYKVEDSDRHRLVVTCPRYGDSCTWRVRAILSKRNNVWQITKYNGPHTCLNPALTQDHRKLDSNMICACILGMVKETPEVPIKLIIERVEREFAYKPSYRKAWKAKQKAIVKIFGDWDKSYEVLPRWLGAMQMYMPGTIVELQKKDFFEGHRGDRTKQVFHRLFWTFKPCVDGFPFCKPIIQIDGTHLYGKYRHKLLIATTQDGDRKPLPLAFAIVEGETKEAWSWFLGRLRIHVTQQQNLCLISDRHASILESVRNPYLGWQPPNAFHVFCIRHIASNFNNRFKNLALKKYLINTGYEPCKHKFVGRLERLTNDPDMANWINSMSKEQWSLAYDEGRRFGHMTTNLSECINGVLKGGRRLPITALVQMTYYKLVEYFVNRLDMANEQIHSGQMYTDDLLKQLQVNISKASTHPVRITNREYGWFQVGERVDPQTHEIPIQYTVKLNERVCDCGEFQALHFPCSHVMAACAAAAIDPLQYVHNVYRMDYVYRCYQGQWHPIKDEPYWPPAPEITLMPDIDLLRAKGRPKSTRIRNEMDWVEQGSGQRCTSCGGVGHNRRRCPIIIGGPST